MDNLTAGQNVLLDEENRILQSHSTNPSFPSLTASVNSAQSIGCDEASTLQPAHHCATPSSTNEFPELPAHQDEANNSTLIHESPLKVPHNRPGGFLLSFLSFSECLFVRAALIRVFLNLRHWLSGSLFSFHYYSILIDPPPNFPNANQSTNKIILFFYTQFRAALSVLSAHQILPRRFFIYSNIFNFLQSAPHRRRSTFALLCQLYQQIHFNLISLGYNSLFYILVVVDRFPSKSILTTLLW